MELWDAYDNNFNRIDGVTLVRGAPIPDGCFHLVCEVLVWHTDGSYLLMQRDRRKHFGGMWEATAGGSALQGETPLQGALRELREETGITATALCEVGRVVNERNRSLYVEFLCVTDAPKNGVVLQDGETIAYHWVDKAQLLAMQPHELVTERMLRLIEGLQP